MRLLDRYLLRELLVPLGYCLAGFLLFWIVFDLFGELGNFQGKRLLVRDVAEYYFILAPEFLVVVLPIALLLALLYALSQHARHHEITAIRTAGISLWRLSAPYFVVGFLASLLLLALNELWVPKSAEAADQVLNRRLPHPAGWVAPNQERDLCFNNDRERRTWRIGLYNSSTAEMLNPSVLWTQPDGSSRWLVAERAYRTNGVWAFVNVHEYKEIPGTNALPLAPVLQAPLLTFPEFSETPEQIKSEISLSKARSLRAARKSDIPILEVRNYLRLHPTLPRSDASWLYTKLEGRLAAPWTCLVVVLIAIPFGAASGRRNMFVGVAGSLIICFIYFILQQFGLALGTGGYLPAWVAAWFPNFSFGLTGIWLMTRVR
jgi:lipopolysaccharide export system permease protein